MYIKFKKFCFKKNIVLCIFIYFNIYINIQRVIYGQGELIYLVNRCYWFDVKYIFDYSIQFFI